MRYLQFKIDNYKGIQNVTLDLDGGLNSKIFTLVGLNESGKTTLLEALAFFHANVGHETELTLTKSVDDDVHSLIPKQSKANFNGKIRLSAMIAIDEIDRELIKGKLDEQGFTMTEFPSGTMRIVSEYTFQNSNFSKKSSLWNLSCRVKKKESPGKGQMLGPGHEAWPKAWEIFTTLIPSVIYYPNFLFDFPDKIFLEPAPSDGKEQQFYRQLLQDILDGLNNNLDLGTHILARAKSEKVQDKDALESVLNKVGTLISRTVFNPDLNIFNKGAGRQIIVSFPKRDSNGRYYIELKLREGEDNYYIRERSLGFRWFFTFLLFTQFRPGRQTDSREVVFLFDEPASNLHPSAQQKILKALESLTSNTGASVIYSTHSHHLINPQWLHSTYIVKNQALDYEHEEDFTPTKTNIAVEKYRAFVGKYPTQRNYFQPILDVLDYRPSNLEDIPDVVMLEGKSDYYAYNYLQEVVFKRPDLLRLVPGVGSSLLDTPIKLYLGWGRNFLILLDSDEEGIRQKRRYLKEFGKQLESRIFTYADIDPTWTDVGLENLLGVGSLALQKAVFPESTNLDKDTFCLAVQDLLISKTAVFLDSDTLGVAGKILAFLEDHLKGLRLNLEPKEVPARGQPDKAPSTGKLNPA